MNIDITKKYTTRSGLPVRIYATDGAGQHPIHGAIKYEGGWDDNTWCADGAYTAGDAGGSRSLIPVKMWRAWKEGEIPVMFMARKKEGADDYSVCVIRAGSRSYAHFFADFLWVHEDGTETPCGVEE